LTSDNTDVIVRPGRTTVFFYETERGEKPVGEFLNGLSEKAKAKCVSYLKQLEEHGNRLPAQYARHLEAELWELRPEWSGTEYRLFYFTLVPGRVYVVHGVAKKRQKTKQTDIETALARIADVRRRVEEEAKNADA
jgi:phage-related protein